MVSSYDEKCLELARHFIDGPAEKEHELALLIQETIEDFLAEEEDDYP